MKIIKINPEIKEEPVIEMKPITVKEELDAKIIYRNHWRDFHGLSGAVSDEGELLACIAFSIKKIDDKEVTPEAAFKFLLSLPKKEKDEIVLNFNELNQTESFFLLLARMAGGISKSDSSLSNGETLDGKKQENLKEQN